jgi:hypothetical protein
MPNVIVFDAFSTEQEKKGIIIKTGYKLLILVIMLCFCLFLHLNTGVWLRKKRWLESHKNKVFRAAWLRNDLNWLWHGILLIGDEG